MSLVVTDAPLSAWEVRIAWCHSRNPGIIYARGSQSGGLFYHGFRISTEDKWSYCYDVTELIGRDNLSEDRQAKGINLNELFQRIIQHNGTAFTPCVYTNLGHYAGADDISWLLNAATSSWKRTSPASETNFSPDSKTPSWRSTASVWPTPSVAASPRAKPTTPRAQVSP